MSVRKIKRRSELPTIGDRYRKKRAAEIEALGGVPKWKHEDQVKQAVHAALMKADEEELSEVVVGIGSPELFVSMGHTVKHGEGYSRFTSGNVDEIHYTGTPSQQRATRLRKAAKQKVEPGTSQQLLEGEEELWGDETIPPPWNMEMLQSLVATSTVHSAAIETKASDYAYSGWELQVTEEATQAGIGEVELDKARAEVTALLKSFGEDGSSVDDFARELAVQYESLGMMGTEAIRSLNARISSFKIMPQKTMRYLSQKCHAYLAGARYVQQRGDRKRYFVELGDNVVYKVPDFDPACSPLDKFPKTAEQRDAFVGWADKLVSATRPRTTDQITRAADGSIAFEEAASELLVFARRPFTMSETYGTPSGIQALTSMMALREIEKYNLQFFESKGVPQYAVIIKGLSSKMRQGSPGRAGTGKTSDPAAQVTQMITKFFTENIKKADRSVLVMQLTGGVEVTFEKLSSDEVEASFAEYEKRMREDIRMAHRMPPAALGINEESANLGSGRESTQMKRYRAHIVLPGQRVIAEYINKLIRHATLIPYFEFVFTPVDIEDDAELRKLRMEMWKHGALTRDELRRSMPGDNPEFGSEPDEDGNGGNGDEMILPASYQVLGASIEDNVAVLEAMIRKQSAIMRDFNAKTAAGEIDHE